MLSTASFLQYTQWSGILTLVFAVLAIVAFILKWGFRFRLVGATGFMIVLTSGLFALSLFPITRTAIPGSKHYSMVYDNGGAQVVVTVAPQITETELEATLRQIASDLYSFGRAGENGNQMTIRARTIIHPEPGVSKPLYLGQVKRSLATRDDQQMQVETFPENIAQIR